MWISIFLRALRTPDIAFKSGSLPVRPVVVRSYRGNKLAVQPLLKSRRFAAHTVKRKSTMKMKMIILVLVFALLHQQAESYRHCPAISSKTACDNEWSCKWFYGSCDDKLIWALLGDSAESFFVDILQVLSEAE